ncbi:probable glutamate receptor [Haliotis cracherodii]|uniref:probable glutamate receptor n=1 Tax=Haliotis cracherodii TaxID=6455 RepID=UPI0039EA5CCE
MLVHLLISLNWQSVLVLREQELGVHFGRSLEASGISYVDYDISFSTEEHLMTILRDVDNVVQPHLNVLLLLDATTTVSVLRQLSCICGTRSNSSVDLCHVSRVLVVGKSDDLPVLLDSNIHLENVALLELPSRYQGHSSKPKMWTLMFHPNGRAFTDVALSSETVTNPGEVFPNVKFGYNGRQLTVVMKDNTFGHGYVIVNKRKLFGFPFSVLNLLAEAMNFSYRIIPPREDDWGSNINGSWTGLLGMLQRREADLASDILTIHSDRTAVADYILPPVAEGKQMIIYKKEEDVVEDDLLIFLRPFQLYVFVIFGVSVIACVIFLSFVRLLHIKDQFNFHVTSKDKSIHQNIRPENKRPPGDWKIQTTTSTTFEIFGAMFKQGSTIRSTHDSERILVATWWMFTTIISAVYCGTIVATFAVKSEKPPFSNMAELTAREDYKIGYDKSSITENLLQNSKQPDHVTIKLRVQDLSTRDPDVFSTNATKHLQKVWEGKYAHIGGIFLSAIGNSSCKLKVIDTTFENSFTAFHLPKSSPFKTDFQKSMYLLSDSGILQRTYQEWFPPIEDEGCSEEDHNPKAVSLVKIQSIFIAVGVGLLCSSMILVAEIVWYNIKQKITLPEYCAAASNKIAYLFRQIAKVRTTSRYNGGPRSLHPGVGPFQATSTAAQVPGLRRISDQTILRTAGILARRPVRRNILTPHHLRERLQWCRQRVTCPQARWKRVLFTDESRFLLRRADGRARVYRRRNERYAEDCVQQVGRFGWGSVMMCGGIHHGGRATHVRVDGALNGLRYRDEILHRHLVPFINANGGIF